MTPFVADQNGGNSPVEDGRKYLTLRDDLGTGNPLPSPAAIGGLSRD